MQYTYLMVVFFSVLIPFIFSFHPKLNFHKHFNAFFKANLLTAFVFIIWDVYFTHLGVWGFSPKYTTGITVINLPIEEVLFFVFIPFASLFTLHCFSTFYNLVWSNKIEVTFIIILSFILFVLGVFNIEKAYTASTFLSTSVFLLLLKFYFKVTWIGEFFSIFPVILIPFFIVNGILTGTGLESPVVWYNNQENLEIRILTIPVEDVFYGIFLLSLNYFLYNRFKLPIKHLIV